MANNNNVKIHKFFHLDNKNIHMLFYNDDANHNSCVDVIANKKYLHILTGLCKKYSLYFAINGSYGKCDDYNKFIIMLKKHNIKYTEEPFTI